MAEPAVRTRLTVEEYLAFERTAEERHEYAEGEIFAGSELRSALRQKSCEVFTSDLRVKIEAANRYTYADVTVVRGPARFEDEKRDSLLNPTAIVEVLSTSTESYDRGEKFALYWFLPSLQEYLLVSQKQPLVEHFRRQTDGSWLLRVFGAEEAVPLPSLGCELSVDEMYFRVFATAAP
jgi:Uma2 family endonuclease